MGTYSYSMLPTLRSLTLVALGTFLTAYGPQTAEARTTSIAPPTRSSRSTHDTYVLGPGDSLQIELLGIPELGGTFSIGPDGTMYIPRLRSLYVEGLSVEELRYFLTDQFKTYVKDPQVYVRPVGYRAVRVYVGGEIERPGYYMLSGGMILDDQINLNDEPQTDRQSSSYSGSPRSVGMFRSSSGNMNLGSGDGMRWPTLFDALRAAHGVTPFSNLSQVQITRKQPISAGGSKIRANVNFLDLVSSGDESVNIRLFDGDVIAVARSTKLMRDQLLAASRTNLSPDFVQVFVSGRVNEPGPHRLPQGATLNQAIASAGGPKLIRGNVEFLRFNPDGSTDHRRFGYNPNAGADDYKNPVLMSGDVVRINNSLLSGSVDVLNQITGPAVGIYSVYSLFKP